MSKYPFNWHKYFAGLAALSVGAALPALAQRGGGAGFGGNFGGGGGAGGRTGSSTSISSRTYPNAGSIGDAYFSIDPESRRVVIISDEQTSLAVSQVLSNLDRPKPQVLLNCVFLEVIHANGSDIGIDSGWGKNIGQGNSASAANGFGVSPLSSLSTNLSMVGGQSIPISQFSSSSSTTPNGAGLYSIAGQNYTATLRAIAQSTSTRVLSKPSILARNNQPATMIVGQELPTITGVTYNGISGSPTYGITWREVGVILKVTPFITPDNMVEMILSPEISTLDNTVSMPIAVGITSPAIDVRSADTVVVTPDGQTVIIGGLIEKDKSVTDTKVPLLGDIPLLGNLFKRQQKSNGTTELMIFVTPHIMQAPSQLAALTDKERQRYDANKGLSERELNQFLEGLPPAPPKAGKKKPAAPKEAP